MSIERPPFWSLDASETGESTKAGGVNSNEMKGWNTTRTHEHFVLSPVSLASIKRARWRPVELDDQHLRSYGKIGDCVQSTLT